MNLQQIPEAALNLRHHKSHIPVPAVAFMTAQHLNNDFWANKNYSSLDAIFSFFSVGLPAVFIKHDVSSEAHCVSQLVLITALSNLPLN